MFYKERLRVENTQGKSLTDYMVGQVRAECKREIRVDSLVKRHESKIKKLQSPNDAKMPVPCTDAKRHTFHGSKRFSACNYMTNVMGPHEKPKLRPHRSLKRKYYRKEKTINKGKCDTSLNNDGSKPTPEDMFDPIVLTDRVTDERPDIYT